MIAIGLVGLVTGLVLHVHYSWDAFLVAIAIGLVADAVRSNRVSQKEAALAALRAYAEKKVG